MRPTPEFNPRGSIDSRLFFANIPADRVEGRRFFITGGTGFFGLWLLSAFALLATRGSSFSVTALTRNPEAFGHAYPFFKKCRWLTFLQGDVTTFSFPPERFDYIIHAATDTSVQAASHPWRLYDTITRGTRHILELALASGRSRVLLTSSGAVYGKFPANLVHIPEDAPCICPPLTDGNTYAEGKRAMETLAILSGNEFGIETVIARCFAFVGYGLPLDSHYAIGNFIHDALYHEAILVKGDGTPLRSYLYAADLAIWLFAILLKGEPGGVYNVGSDEALSIVEIAHLVRDVLAPQKNVVIQDEISNSPETRSVYVPAIAKARTELHLAPWTTLPAAIRLTAAAHRGNIPPLIARSPF
jgi:dTDP-glucose 4,6-dehydratase